VKKSLVFFDRESFSAEKFLCRRVCVHPRLMITQKRRPNYHEKRLIRANAEEDSVVLLFKAMDRVISRLTSTFYKNINDFETENDFNKEVDYNNSTTAMLSQSQQRKMSGIVLAGLKMNGKYRKRNF